MKSDLPAWQEKSREEERLVCLKCFRPHINIERLKYHKVLFCPIDFSEILINIQAAECL